MFAWIRPRRSAAFNFTFSAADERYGKLINDRFASLVHNGTVPGWLPVSSEARPVHDGLPSDWAATEMRLPDAPPVRGD